LGGVTALLLAGARGSSMAARIEGCMNTAHAAGIKGRDRTWEYSIGATSPTMADAEPELCGRKV
jgi:hypothetical protein